MAERWKCPKCGRSFAKNNQSHSCNVYPLSAHFKGRPLAAKSLFRELVSKMKEGIGPFRVDPVECCIHLVTSYAFAGIYVMKDGLRISFTTGKKVKSPRIRKHAQVSAHRHTYQVEIRDSKDIDPELMGWLKAAYADSKG